MMSVLVYAVNVMSTWTYMNIRGQGHSLTLVRFIQIQPFSNFFFLETAGSFETKFQMEPPWNGVMEDCSSS